ncbi:uncharacterized protein LOC121856387 [Homarus americanus]|nr:uncharacterized protein LOC121856387 [Homarus americanus]XP_042207882.1 uncharacterized protein LOC121856387 [Homarus americanus]
MSVIIRLQNLPWSANALDIREFFKGLSIPEGGVHIVGGELGDAFIAFSTDEDARLAMQKTGSSLKGIQVTLLLSSRSEMQKVIEAARQQAMALQGYMAPTVIPTQPQQPPVPPVPQLQQPPPSTMQHQQLPPHVPYQAHPHAVVLEAQQQMQPRMVAHISSPPNQPNMQQPPSIPMPPSVHPSQTPHSSGQAASHGPPNSSSTNDLQTVTHLSSSTSNSEKKEEKKSSATSTSSSSKRDNKGRDSRRRRSKTRSRSRSRSRDRDRRRRHRTRSRSRSRDRSSRSRRRTRSRERDRGRDRNRDRDRDRDRDKDRSNHAGRERNDRISQENNETVTVTLDPPAKESASGAEGIPGLGDIPSASMRGPLPSLSEPIKNSPIQTPSPGPNQAYSSAQPYNSGSSYHTAPPFTSGPPLNFGNMSVPPPAIPMVRTFNEPMETEPGDDHPIILEGPGEFMDNQMSGKPNNQRNEHSGQVRGPGDGPQRTENKGLLGDGPSEAGFGNFFGRGMPMRNNEGLAFGHPRSRPLLKEPGSNEFNDQFDPRLRNESSQMGWESKDGKEPVSSSKQREFKEDRDPRDKSFRNEIDMREGRSSRDDRQSKDGKDTHEDRDSRDDPDRSGWESRGKRDSHSERGTRWEAADRREDGDESSSWSSRSRREGWKGRDEGSWSRSSGDKRESWSDKDSWKHDSHSWEEDSYYHRDQDRHGDDHDRYGDGYSYRGYRSRGGRGMDRGRISRGGRGYNPRFSGYHEGYKDENHEDGYGYRGGYRGRGSYRGRGGSYNYREGSSEWGEDSTCSVEIRNIPPGTSYRAIRELFRGIYVPKTSIKLLADDHGNRIDIALLQFSSPRDAHKAIRCSGNYIFDNKVEVTLISEAKYEAAVDVNKMGMMKGYPGSRAPVLAEEIPWPDSTCVCVSGLPLECAEHDVAQMFSQFKIQDIVLEREKGTRQPSGRCFVRLNSPEEVHQSLVNLLNASIDGNPLTVEVCPPDAITHAARDRDLMQSSQQSGKSQQNPASTQKGNSTQQEKKTEEKKSENQNGEEPPAKHLPVGADLLTDSVVMKGVPKDATEANIRDFFSDEGLVPERVHFCDANSKGLHEVYIMFPLIEDARRAVGKSQQQLCKVKVEIDMVAKPVVMSAMGLPFDPLELIRKGQKTGTTAVPGKSEKNAEHASDDKKPSTQTKATSASTSKEKQEHGNQNQASQSSVDQQPGDPGQEHSHNIEQQNSNSFSSSGVTVQGLYRGGGMAGYVPGGSRGFRPRGDMRGMNRMPVGMSGPRGPSDGSFTRMRGSVPLLRDPVEKPAGEETMGTAIPPENFGKPGCVVALGNVPYRATTDDILEFFHEFPGLRPENIIRRYNEFNQPTADARVAFPSAQEAQRAVQTLNRKFMTHRQVFLSLVSE